MDRQVEAGSSGIIELEPVLAADCTLITLRVRPAAGGVELEEALDVDGRVGWQRRWVWRFLHAATPETARPVDVGTIAATLTSLLADGCTVEQITTFTGCHWPTRILADDGLDGIVAACLGRGWSLWPHPIDPATPDSPAVWRITTAIDGCRFALGEDEYITRVAAEERRIAPNPACLYGFTGVENRDGNPSPGWEVHTVACVVPDDPTDRERLLTLLHKWIPLAEIAAAADLRPSERNQLPVDGGEVPGDRVIFDVPHGHGSTEHSITRCETHWSWGILVDGEWSEVHRWSGIDNSEGLRRNVAWREEDVATIADVVFDALVAGATPDEIIAFTTDVWPFWTHAGMLDDLVDACTGQGWCLWPEAPNAEPRDIAGMWSATVVGGTRYTVDAIERVIQLGGIRAVEVPVGGRTVLSAPSPVPGFPSRVHILEGFRHDRPEHWAALIGAARSGALDDARPGVTSCGDFVALLLSEH